jgi:alpha-beta hydrolase superfamily lysophospholipase
VAAPRELQLAAADGTALFAADWPAEHDTGRNIVIMHGLGEHCGRYAHVARFFNECGYAVRTYDHRGHGRSGGARGDTPDNDTILHDAKIVFDDFARRCATPPLLLGHSMGGLVAARFATGALSPIGGLILSSPALAIPLSGTQKILLKTLGAIAPGLGVPNGLQTRYLSHDPAVETAYVKDPLVHARITPRLLRSMLAAIDFCHANAPRFDTPTLLVVAGDDHLVDASGSAAFHARLKPGVAAMHCYDDYYHEIFNEVGAAKVFEDVRMWLKGRIR